MGERPGVVFDPAIREYYDRAPEEARLERGASQLEHVRSQELILRHAPQPPAVVLDVGGAAGVYSFWLAELGYEVRLLDAVPRLIEVARLRNEHATVGAGFDVEGLYGIEGPGSILPDLVERWRDPVRRQTLIEVARALESEPTVPGCSAHLMVVAQKPGDVTR